MNIKNIIEGDILLNDNEFRLLCERHQLSDDAISEIQHIRNSQPARRVESSRGNLSGFYSSKKMGVTIQYESHTLELPCIYLLEHDSKVYEYYDQPPSFPIRYKVNEKRRGHIYTSDYFIISEDFIGWRECKTQNQMEKLSRDHPERYRLVDDNSWDMPPVREYAQQLGLSFNVWTDHEIDWTFQSNLEFLEDYYLEDILEVNKESLILIKDIVRHNQGISLRDLCSQVGGDSDSIYKSLILEELYIDLHLERLTEWDFVKVYTDITFATAFSMMHSSRSTTRIISPTSVDIKVGNKLQWDGRAWTIINYGETKMTMVDENDEPITVVNTMVIELIKNGEIKSLHVESTTDEELNREILMEAGPKDIEEANRRFEVVFPIISGEKKAIDFDIPSRTIRDWITKYKWGEEVYGSGFTGLISNRKNQGNRSQRLNKETIELMNLYIETEYETSTNKVMKSVWRALKEKCKEKGIYCPPYQTFTEYVNARPEYEQTKNREGYKAANKHKPFHYFLELQTPRHGERPYHIGHIDHTELDLELKCSKTGKSLGKAWITFFVDAFTRRILSFYLTFDPPSYRSCMMVIRECVKRQGRLPKTIVVDGGKEFGSVYFDALLAVYKLSKKVRKGQPRVGSVIERMFGVTNKMFIHNLRGNTQVMKNARQVTPDVNPKGKSVWTLPELAMMMATWVYEVYETREHVSLGESPRDAHLNGIAKTGKRNFTLIAYNEEFKLLTLPATRNKTLKVHVGRGVKLNYIYYNAPALKQPGIENTQVPVRYDPYNMGIAYAYVKNKWVLLRSEHYLTFLNRTEKELQLITEELHKRTKNTVKNGDSITASKIAAFMQSVEGKQVSLMQHMCDIETKRALNGVVHDFEIEEVIEDITTDNEELQHDKNEEREYKQEKVVKVDFEQKKSRVHENSNQKTNHPKEKNYRVVEELIF